MGVAGFVVEARDEGFVVCRTVVEVVRFFVGVVTGLGLTVSGAWWTKDPSLSSTG